MDKGSNVPGLLVGEPELGVGLHGLRHHVGAGGVLDWHIGNGCWFDLDERPLVQDLDDRLFLLLLGVAAAEEALLWGLRAHHSDI